MVVTTLMPVPDDMPSWLPPAEKMIGTMLAMPKPQRAKAAMRSRAKATGRRPACRRRRRWPSRAASPPRRSGCARRRRKAHDRHDAGKGGVGEAGNGEVGAEFLPEIKRCPVEHGAFGDHRQQRHQPDQIDQRVGRQREFVMLGGLRLVLGDEVADRHRDDGKSDDCDDCRMGEVAVSLDGVTAQPPRRNRRGSRSHATTT